MFGAVPPTWVDAAVTFLANNRYDGWQPEDVGTEDFLRNDVGPLTQNARNVLKYKQLRTIMSNHFHVALEKIISIVIFHAILITYSSSQRISLTRRASYD